MDQRVKLGPRQGKGGGNLDVSRCGIGTEPLSGY